MNQTATYEGSPFPMGLVIVLLLAFASAFYVYYDGLALMVQWWERDEYSHGYMIPLVAGFMFWQKLPQLQQLSPKGSFWAFPFIVFGLFLYVLGELSTVYTLLQYGFIVTFYGLVIAVIGIRGSLLVWASLAYLLFMIPLPNFLYNNLSGFLQLVSSQLGVAFLRLVDVSVYLEGNVIDLGSYKLQVVEACSGLRYLFPLASFSFLVAYLYRGPVWLKVLVFLSAAPITLLMNSFRIAVIGITVDNWGIEMAEGFLHSFEGWFIFLACLVILFLEIWVLDRFVRSGRSFVDQFDLDIPPLSEIQRSAARASDGSAPASLRPLYTGLLLLLMAVPLSIMVNERQELLPERSSFTLFPLLQGQWLGRESSLDTEVLSALKLTDHFIADYQHPDYQLPVNFYMAYYASQRKGASAHSPQSCIPGGGWVVESIDTVDLNDAFQTMSPALPLRANRTVISKGNVKQLVYYWFQQRGRIITNEYLAKWYIFWDSMTRNRTDGALVRLVIPVPDGTSVADADAQLKLFINDFYPQLIGYIPE